MVHNPTTGSGREIESRFLAVYKNDFLSHGEGGYLRHTADQTDMNPVIPAIGGANVQVTLENLAGIITSTGSGFVSIGDADGYAQGTYNVNTSETPSFAEAVTAAQADDRLQNGGVILLMAGTYIIDQSVTINPGMTLMGESQGTYLIGETTEQSLFIVSSTVKNLNIGGDSGGGTTAPSPGSQSDQIKLTNLIIFDNLNGSNTTMATVPMISVRKGAALVVQNVSFFGKLNDGSATNRIKTKAAIATIAGVSNPTSLTVENCFFDGLKTAISFDPQIGDQDFLKVSGCKARIFGQEAVSYTAGADCFIFASVCVLEVINNFVTSGATNMKTLVNLGTTGGSTSNVRIIISGNIGNISVDDAFILDNDSSTTTLTTLIANNNWGIHSESAWTIVVGGSDGDSPTGDLFGPNAVNTLITWANSLSLETTAIINPGTYTVTLSSSAANNVANLKLIGNKKGRNYPILQLDISSTSTDSLGNRYVVLGNHLESLYFTSVSNYASVRPAFHPTGIAAQTPAHTMTVKDCIFNDASLNILNLGASSFADQLGNPAGASIVISDCQFFQTGDYDDNIGLVCPRADLINISRCYFSGNGYALNVGTETYSTVTRLGHYVFDHIISDLSNGDITTAAPGSATNHYWVIKDLFARVTLKNCVILADAAFAGVTPIGGTLQSDPSPFDAFVSITALGITMDNCLLSGPNQPFAVAGVNYAMPCLKLVPSAQLSLNNCKLHSGGLPCQISSAFGSTTFRDAISIKNCDFQGPSDSSSQCLTMLDIDLEPSGTSTNQTEVNISGCSFLPRKVVGGRQVLHTFVTGAAYDTHGIVQIYVTGMDCNFSNNRIYGALHTPTINPYTHLTGLVINTFNSDAGNTTNLNGTIVNSNHIKIHDNNYAIASATNSASCGFFRTSALNVVGNIFNFENSAAILASFAGCLVIDTRVISSVGDGIISNNFFNNQSATGFFSFLSRAYILILSTSNLRGQIVNNSFGNATIDGVSNTTMVEDNTATAAHWLVAYNKNQTETITVRGNYGNLAVKDTANTYFVESGVIPSIASSNAAFVNSSSNTVFFDYNDTSDDQTFIWTIPLIGIVPTGAYVTAVSVVVDVSANPSTTSIATLFYRDTSSSTNTVQNPLTTSGATLSLTFTTNTRPVTPTKGPVIELLMRCNSNAICDITIDQMSITYRW